MKIILILAPVLLAGCEFSSVSRGINSEINTDGVLGGHVALSVLANRSSVENDLISRNGSRDESHYTIRKHFSVAEAEDGLSVVWVTTGGRVGEGLVGVYLSEEGSLITSSQAFGPLRNVFVIDSGNDVAYIFIEEIQGSGTGFHHEKTRLYHLNDLDVEIWSRDSKRTEVGPYPEGKHIEREYQFYFDEKNLYFVELELRQELDGDRAWSSPEYTSSLFFLVKGDDEVHQISGTETNRLELDALVSRPKRGQAP